YTVQQQWSNMQNGCVSAPAHFDLTVPNSVIPGRPFNVTVAPKSTSNAGLPNYGNTVHFTSSDSASPTLPTDYTFIPASDQGSHTFSITLNTLGTETLTVTDTLVTAMTGTATVNVAHNPDLIVTKTHVGNFKQGDVGDAYTITVKNDGDRPTDGTAVLLIDT